jgi:cbb3-type cytochrome oxidase cytochrome c subunit
MRIQIVTETGRVFTYPNMEVALMLLNKVIKRYGAINQIAPVERELSKTPKTVTGQQPMGACPECGAPVALEEGCKKCHSCGYSACG